MKKFIDENFERDPKSFVSSKEIHAMYLKYATENNLESISQKTLSRRLNDLRIGVPQKRMFNYKTVPVRFGLKVK